MKTAQRKLNIAVALLSLIGLFLGPLFPAQAQESVGISVSPPSFDFGLNPGAKESNVLKVSNPSSSSVSLEVKVENILGTTDVGQVSFTEEETEFSISKWVSVSPSRFELKPGETRAITFTISVPSNAEPGGHYGSILIGTVAAAGNTTGSSTVQRVGSLLLVRVAGKAEEAAFVANFSPKTLVGSWKEIRSQDNTTTFYIADEEKLDQEHNVSYFSKGPVAFDLVIKNTGNVHFKPAGFITIYNIFGKKVAEVAVEPKNIFPGVERKLTVIWPTTNLWGGYYKAQLTAVYGQNNQTLTSTTSFWAFPLVSALVIGGLLVLIIIFRRRLAKVVKVLVKG